MPGKKKKPEPESEEESEKEESEEEAEEGSEDEEDEEKGSDEEEEEGDEDEEDEDEDEDKGSDEEKSEKSDDSEGSEKSSKSEGSDESEGSDSSGKKKKKKKDKKDKKKGKDKDKGKDKKGKNKDKPAEENKKGPAKDNPPDPPKLTIASVFDDLDELSNHLARTFASFQPKEEVNNLQKQPSLLLKNPSPPVSPGKELTQTKGPIHPASSLPLSNHGYKPENARPQTEDAGVQYGAASTVRRHASPEAIRAVQEYKQRKEQEKKRAESPEEIVSAQNDRPRKEVPPQPQFYSTGRSGQGTYEKPRREERKAEQEEVTDFRKRTVSPNKPGTGPKFNQIAENYYANLYKKSTKNPVSAQKTIQDLYKYKPKPTFVEDESQPIAPYYENEFSIPRSRPGYETYDPRLKSQHKSPNERYDPLKSNKKQISDAVDVLTRRGGNNPNF